MSEQTANLCTTDAAESLREIVAERDREIERLKEGQSILILARDEQKRLANEYRDMWSRAAVKAQPSGVVQWPDADEIMQMAFEEGQPGDDASGYYFELEEFDLFIQRLMEEVARLNSSPVSAGDENSEEGLEEWAKGKFGVGGRYTGKLYGNTDWALARVVWSAALSAPSHGEQVLVPRSIAQRMATDAAQYDHEHAIVNDNVQLWQQKNARLSLTVGDLRAVRALLSAPSAGSQKEQK